jgi:hypothetical protein
LNNLLNLINYDSLNLFFIISFFIKYDIKVQYFLVLFMFILFFINLFTSIAQFCPNWMSFKFIFVLLQGRLFILKFNRINFNFNSKEKNNYQMLLKFYRPINLKNILCLLSLLSLSFLLIDLKGFNTKLTLLITHNLFKCFYFFFIFIDPFLSISIIINFIFQIYYLIVFINLFFVNYYFLHFMYYCASKIPLFI